MLSNVKNWKYWTNGLLTAIYAVISCFPKSLLFIFYETRKFWNVHVSVRSLYLNQFDWQFAHRQIKQFGALFIHKIFFYGQWKLIWQQLKVFCFNFQCEGMTLDKNTINKSCSTASGLAICKKNTLPDKKQKSYGSAVKF